jgi:hypothetical protein
MIAHTVCLVGVHRRGLARRGELPTRMRRARKPAGVCARILQRLLALTAAPSVNLG